MLHGGIDCEVFAKPWINAWCQLAVACVVWVEDNDLQRFLKINGRDGEFPYLQVGMNK
jgi:hypothetical protein